MIYPTTQKFLIKTLKILEKAAFRSLEYGLVGRL